MEATRSGSISTAQAAPFWPKGKPRPAFLKPPEAVTNQGTVMHSEIRSSITLPSPVRAWDDIWVPSLLHFALVNTGSPREAVADQVGTVPGCSRTASGNEVDAQFR